VSVLRLNRLLSRRVANDETDLLALVGEVARLGEVVWAVDVIDGGAALLLAILLGHDHTVLYLPGRAVHRAAAGYRGEGKTDARDAAIIADQARMRRDLAPVRPGDETTAVSAGALFWFSLWQRAARSVGHRGPESRLGPATARPLWPAPSASTGAALVVS
jgi:hypothetical protein